MPPSGGILLQIVPAGLGNVLGYLGSVARASAMYRTYPESSLTLRALGRLSNPSEGPAYTVPFPGPCGKRERERGGGEGYEFK
jgi:hypothetical protein